MNITKSYLALKKYCEKEQFKGYDPFDGLNSKLFQKTPFIKNNRYFRLIWIQFFKRFPFNLRSIVGIEKGYNSKGLGLFLSSYCILYNKHRKQEDLNQIIFLANKLIEIQNNNYSGSCWGYNIDWQARAFFQPKNTPTVVASTYIANAFLDAYEITKDDKYLKIARSTCDFILNDLNRNYDNDGDFAFSYSPLDKSIVYNASLLGSRILSRVYSYTLEEELIIQAKKSISFCCKKQKKDGSWSYGEYSFHQWVDNFHTGFNLECINTYIKISNDHSFDKEISKGLSYYLNTFFTTKGQSKYYNNQLYPIDIHAPAQLIVTLKNFNILKNNELAAKVIQYTIREMQNTKGYFYYQKKKYFSSKIPYMRWAQAWMFYALTIYLEDDGE